MSWRDDASQEAQDDLDQLLGHGLQFAQMLLEKRGGFVPFGAAVSRDGELRMMMAGAGELVGGDDDASSEDQIGLLFAGITGNRDDLRAGVVVSDVRINGADAIRLELEHRDGHAMNVFLPYDLPGDDAGEIKYGDLGAMPSDKHIWSD